MIDEIRAVADWMERAKEAEALRRTTPPRWADLVCVRARVHVCVVDIGDEE